MALLIGLLALGMLGGCGRSGSIGTNGNGQGYVAGDGALTLIAPQDRGQPVQVEGPALPGQPGQPSTVKLGDYRGKVVLVNVWASWCTPCRAEAPGLQAAWMAAPHDQVQFIGVNTRDGATTDAAQAFMRRFGLTYPSLVDPDGSRMLALRELPPSAVPATLILDRQGRLAARALGQVSQATVSGLISDELARP